MGSNINRIVFNIGIICFMIIVYINLYSAMKENKQPNKNTYTDTHTQSQSIQWYVNSMQTIDAKQDGKQDQKIRNNTKERGKERQE